jgi:hypothetical protein
MDLDPTVQVALMSVPNKQIFSRPMSKKARMLLNSILKWAYHYSGKCFKSTMPAVDCYNAFAAEYSPIKFEDACHRFDMGTYVSTITKTHKPNKADNLIGLMLLRCLSDSWVNDNGIKENASRVGTLTTDRAAQIYEWATTNFLITDFTDAELNKLATLADEKYTLQAVKDAAAQIYDVDKRSISYLYAIVRDSAMRNDFARDKERALSSRYESSLKQLFANAGPKIEHELEDKTAEWNRERAWLELMRDIKERE